MLSKSLNINQTMTYLQAYIKVELAPRRFS